jgi:hypothetical protein
MIPRPFKPFPLCSDWLASSSRRSVFCWHLATTTLKKTLVGMLFIRIWIRAAKSNLGKTRSRAGTARTTGRTGTKKALGTSSLLVPRWSRQRFLIIPNKRCPDKWEPHPSLDHVIGGFSNLFDESKLGLELWEIDIPRVFALHAGDQEFAAPVK